MSLRYDNFQRSRILKNHREIFNMRIGEGTESDSLYSVRKSTMNKYKSQRKDKEEQFGARRREVDESAKKLIERREQEKLERERQRNLEKEKEFVNAKGSGISTLTLEERKKQREEANWESERRKKEQAAQWQRAMREIDSARDRANNKRDRRINWEVEQNKPRKLRIPDLDAASTVSTSSLSSKSYTSSLPSSSYSSTTPSYSTSSYQSERTAARDSESVTRPRRSSAAILATVASQYERSPSPKRSYERSERSTSLTHNLEGEEHPERNSSPKRTYVEEVAEKVSQTEFEEPVKVKISVSSEKEEPEKETKKEQEEEIIVQEKEKEVEIVKEQEEEIEVVHEKEKELEEPIQHETPQETKEEHHEEPVQPQKETVVEEPIQHETPQETKEEHHEEPVQHETPPETQDEHHDNVQQATEEAPVDPDTNSKEESN